MIQNAPISSLLAWMGSLADATRLRVLWLLERQELGVAELCEVLQLPQSTVSRHLKVLADDAWVRHRREGTANLYRMSLDDLTPAARKLWLLAREQTHAWAAPEQDRLRLRRVLQKRQRDSQAFFAGAAAEWDSLRDWLYGRGFWQAVLGALLPADWVVADLGCGTGALAAELAPQVRKVIGVDQSAAMLKAARKRLAAVGLNSRVDLRQGPLEPLPIPDAACDAAVMVLVLSYLKDPPRALAQAARVVKPGGRLVIVDLLLHDRDDFRRNMGQIWPGFEPAKLTALLQDSGWKQVVCRPLPPEEQAKGPALLLASGVRGQE